MAKLLKLRRGSTSQHGSFTGAEGEVTVDTDKDTLVVHDGSTAGGHPVAAEDMANVSSASIAGRLATDSIATTKIAAGALPTDVTVASANIVNGTIINEDVNASAAIAGTKVAPAFGSQNLSTSGTAATGALTVTGNITVSGTVDGVDVAMLGGLSSSSGVLTNGVTATTQSASDNSTKVATTAYTDTAITNLVDSSPGALNTLNELAAAINDDASFSTTVNNNIATKMPLAGGEFTGDVISHNITPDSDSSRNIGNNTTRFQGVYADTFYGSGAQLTGIEAFVSGMILLWSGAENAIPSGFVLCNGSNSTPDLRDRFVVGAGSSYSVGATGGADSRTVTISGSDTVSISGSDTVNISGSATVNITVSGNVPILQRHYTGWGYRLRYNNAPGGGTTYDNNRWNDTSNTMTMSGSDTFNFSGSDTVNISGTDTVNISGSTTVDTRSPYYALCYIMKT